MSDRTFSLQQGIAAQHALRNAMNLPPERFPLPEFIGMLSDEVQQMRENGRSDEEIAIIVSKAVGEDFTADMILKNYASAEVRHRG